MNLNSNDARKAGLLGGALLGSLAVGTSAQELPTVEGITGDVNARIGESGGDDGGSSGGGISVGGGGGGTVSTGGSSGGGTVSTGDISGGGDMQIGGDEGLAVADASGGNNNVSFVS